MRACHPFFRSVHSPAFSLLVLRMRFSRFPHRFSESFLFFVRRTLFFPNFSISTLGRPLAPARREYFAHSRHSVKNHLLARGPRSVRPSAPAMASMEGLSGVVSAGTARLRACPILAIW